MTCRGFGANVFQIRLEEGDNKCCRNISSVMYMYQLSYLRNRLRTCYLSRHSCGHWCLLRSDTEKCWCGFGPLWILKIKGFAALWISETLWPQFEVRLYLFVYCRRASSTFPWTVSDFTGSASPLFWALVKPSLHGTWAQKFYLVNIEFVISAVTSTYSVVYTPTQEPHALSK